MSSAPASKESLVRIAQDAVVCLDCKLKGHITIGSRTVVHPRVTIIGDGGLVAIGENNIFEEQSLVYHRYDPEKDDRPQTLMIGSNNVFEVGCTIEAKVIGDNNTFEAKSYVGPEVEVGNGCIIGAGVRLSVKEKLPDNVIITGCNYNRSVASDKPAPQTLQLDFLTKVLPNYHHIRKNKERPSILSLKPSS